MQGREIHRPGSQSHQARAGMNSRSGAHDPGTAILVVTADHQNVAETALIRIPSPRPHDAPGQLFRNQSFLQNNSPFCRKGLGKPPFS
jgi:hypothetical protein